MKKLYLFLLLLSLASPALAQYNYKYPSLAQSHNTESRFGHQFIDPYTSLINTNADSTTKWLNAQNKLLDQYRRLQFTQYRTCQQMLAGNIIDRTWAGIPVKRRALYLTINDNPDGQPVVYYKTSLSHEFRQLCPINIFQHNDKDKLFIRGMELSPDNKYLAIIISHSGSDWMEVRIRDIEAQKFLPDKLSWLKFNGIVWNNEGLYYVRFNEPDKGRELIDANRNQRLMYHKLGSNAIEDQVLFTTDNTNGGDITLSGFDKEKMAIIHYSRTEKSRRVSVVAYFKPDSIKLGIKEFIATAYNGFSQFKVAGILGGQFLVHSTFKHPYGQVVLYDGDKVNSGTVLIQQSDQPLRFVNKLRDRIFCVYYNMGKFTPVVFDTTGTVLTKLEIPEGFSIDGFEYAINDSTTLYTMHSFVAFPRTVRFDFKNLKSVVYNESVKTMYKTGYTSRIVKYYSKDSTVIPMYIVHNRNLKPDTTTPLLLYAYGGFGRSLDPEYDPGFKLFMQAGGVLAIPLIRGGGELGEVWHKAGMRQNKQNSTDDFIAAAEYLVACKMASPDRIAIHGGSNGGLLVGMAMIQRPELFKAVVSTAGIFDLANFHKFTSAAYVAVREYGNPEDSIEFKNLIRLSPLHNINTTTQYPATMVIAGTHDDRVVPSHSYRFIASLQGDVKTKFNPPYLLYLQENMGHNTEGTLADFQQLALMYTFIFDQLDIDINKPF